MGKEGTGGEGDGDGTGRRTGRTAEDAGADDEDGGGRVDG